MKQTTTRVFALPVRPCPLSEFFVLRSKRAYKWVPMRWFPVQHRECCQRNWQGTPQTEVSSIKNNLMRKPLFVFFILMFSLFASPTAFSAAIKPESKIKPPSPSIPVPVPVVDKKPVIKKNIIPKPLPALLCTNTLNTLPEMQLIPAGVFNMGSPENENGRENDEGPLHQVTIYRSFALSRCEITVGQFKRFVAETDYQTDAERNGGCFTLNKETIKAEKKASANWKNTGFEQTDDHPVVCISWQDAKAYSRWLSVVTKAVYRLPTEAEWEYAARTLNGSDLSRYWGDDPDKGCEYANGADQTLKKEFPTLITANCDDGISYTQVAGSYARNAFGLSDMLGNAWEWVEDCYVDNYDSAPIDGSSRQQNQCDRRVIRGGGWDDLPVIIRSANRIRGRPDGADGGTGFRIARAL